MRKEDSFKLNPNSKLGKFIMGFDPGFIPKRARKFFTEYKCENSTPKKVKILGLATDRSWLSLAIEEDMIVFGLEASKYPDAESLVKGIEDVIASVIADSLAKEKTNGKKKVK